MKVFILFILFWVAAVASANDFLSHIQGNYCQDDVHHYVRMRFGPDARVTKVFHVLAMGGNSHYVYFQVNVCEGDIVASFRGDVWQCLNVQARRRIQILNQVYTLSPSCRRFMPASEFPDLYN